MRGELTLAWLLAYYLATVGVLEVFPRGPSLDGIPADRAGNISFALALFSTVFLGWGRMITGLMRRAEPKTLWIRLYDSIVLPALCLAVAFTADFYTRAPFSPSTITSVQVVALAVWLALALDPTGLMSRSIISTEWFQRSIENWQSRGTLQQLTFRYPPREASDVLFSFLVLNLGLGFLIWLFY